MSLPSGGPPRTGTLRWIFATAVAFVAGIVLGTQLAHFQPPTWLHASSDWTATSEWLKYQSPVLLPLAALATTVAAIVGAIGLPFAVIAAFGVRHQALLQRKIAQEQSSRECLFQFSREWNEGVAGHIEPARDALKKESWKHSVDAQGFTGKTEDHVTEVLNFFDKLAYMQRRGDLDMELAWTTFGDNPVTFEALAREFIRAYRAGEIQRSPNEEKAGDKDMTYWEALTEWAKDVAHYDRQRRAEANKRAP